MPGVNEFGSAASWIDLCTVDFIFRPSLSSRQLDRNIFMVRAGYLRFFDAVKWTIVASRCLSIIFVAEIVFFVTVHLVVPSESRDSRGILAFLGEEWGAIAHHYC